MVVTIAPIAPQFVGFLNYIPLIVNTMGCILIRKDILLASCFVRLEKVEKDDINTGTRLKQESSLASPVERLSVGA